MAFILDPVLVDIIRPGVLWLEGATVVARDPRMDAPLAAAEAAIRASPPEEVTAVRTMYKRVGIDPTKTRPSSEALLRRVRKGDSLPRINSMVDVCNWCSFEFQLPYGLYDADRIEGEVELRIGREGESYPGIRKDDVHVGGRIALVDSRGPFGNPTSDSARTMVTTSTRRALLVIFAPIAYPPQALGRVIDTTASRMHEFTGAHEVSRVILSP
jgi:DNA/RNA-binding domain of Phe-tRNA-synthetase-like protein